MSDSTKGDVVHAAPWYESNIFWGCISIGIGIILAVVAAMKHDSRWLLWFAWPCFVIAAWSIARHSRHVWKITACAIAFAGIGLYSLGRWLRPTPTEAALPTPTPISTPSPTVTPSPASKPPHRPKITPTPPPFSPPTQNCPNGVCIGRDNNGSVVMNPPENPNRTQITYDCAGNRRTTGPTANTAFSSRMEAGVKDAVAEKMRQLFNSSQYQELLQVCQAEIASSPEWLTPYLYCGLGYVGTNQMDLARKMQEHYDTNAGAAYDDGVCRQASSMLHAALH